MSPRSPGTDADGVLHGYHEDTAVAYLARLGSLLHGGDGLLTFLSRTTMFSNTRSMQLVLYITPR